MVFLFFHSSYPFVLFFFFNDTATTEIYTLSLHDALPISLRSFLPNSAGCRLSGVRAHLAQHRLDARDVAPDLRSEVHTSELQSRVDLVCRLLLEKKKKKHKK